MTFSIVTATVLVDGNVDVDGDDVAVALPLEFPLPQSLGYVNGDGVPNHRFGLRHRGGVLCIRSPILEHFVLEAAAIEWQVTYSINFPPVCDGDSLAIVIIDAPSFASHEWLTTHFPDSTASYESTLAYCNGSSASNDEAYYFALDPPGVSGTIRRTTCHQAPDFSTTTCVTDTTFEIEVAPNRPSLGWTASTA